MEIVKRFWGKKIQEIPTREFYFTEFDVYNEGADYFGLVLAAIKKVPASPTEEWRLGSMQTCGYHFHQDKAAFLPLKIRSEARKLIESIVDEDFARLRPSPEVLVVDGDGDSLDHYCMGQDASNDGQDRILQAYLAFLDEHGLKWTPRKPEGIGLKQALYPIDATKEMLQRLSPSIVDIDEVDPDGSCGLVIWVVGVNCD